MNQKISTTSDYLVDHTRSRQAVRPTTQLCSAERRCKSVVSLRLVQVTVRRRNKVAEMFNDDEFAYEESRQKGAKDGT